MDVMLNACKARACAEHTDGKTHVPAKAPKKAQELLECLKNSAMLRRDFLTTAGAGVVTSAAACLTPTTLLASTLAPRALPIVNLHTGEGRLVEYWADNEYIPEGVRELNKVLRDHRSGDVYDMDTKLYDLMFLMHRLVRAQKPFHIVSGYRSPRTNAALRKKSENVARNSYHMKGMASDIRIPGFETHSLRFLARKIRAGGVGYYSRSDFLHVDVGPVRSWGG